MSLPLREVLPEHQPERKWSRLPQPTATKGQQRCSESDQCQQKMDAWNELGSWKHEGMFVMIYSYQQLSV